MSSAAKGKARGPPAAARPRRQKEEEVVVAEEELTIVPPDQVKLTPKQLDEDVTRVVTATRFSPHCPRIRNRAASSCVWAPRPAH